ncbi:Hypothetical predicted protein [Octopus vulgaris]|uniref:Uncharacterized protein n=1 Tax=Octopus vulgaris TaxID=6645 RepID=A0AA36B5S5_OCTVU|nr:Hypothetical predicted protein [Octopus vulgaris]
MAYSQEDFENTGRSSVNLLACLQDDLSGTSFYLPNSSSSKSRLSLKQAICDKHPPRKTLFLLNPCYSLFFHKSANVVDLCDHVEWRPTGESLRN